MISTSALRIGTPPAVSIGSFGLNVWWFPALSDPLNVCSRKTICSVALGLSTACTTTFGVDRGTATVPSSHADAATSASSAALKANRDTGRRQEWELRDRLFRRRARGIVEDVHEHVLRVVGVHHADVRRDRRAAHR